MKARVGISLFLMVSAAFAYACGGDDTSDSGVDSGGNDGTVANDTGKGNDTGTGTDTGTGNDTGTGSDTGTGNDSGTTTDSGGTDGSTAFKCTKPSDCTNEFCCGTVVFNGGNVPNCKLADASSQCSATCNSNIKVSCTATDTMRGCAAKNDCLDAGTGYMNCCNVPFGNQSFEFCWDKNIAGLIQGASCL